MQSRKPIFVFNPRIQEAEPGWSLCELKANLVFSIVSSRKSRAIYLDRPCLKNAKNQN